MIRSLKYPLILFLLAGICILFLSTPFEALSTSDHSFLRGLFFILPFADPGLYLTQIFGETGPRFLDVSRFQIIGIGLVLLAAVLGTGRFLLFLGRGLRRKSVPGNHFSNWGEKLFISFLLGFAAVSVYFSWLGFFGIAGKAAVIPLWGFAVWEIISISTGMIKHFRDIPRTFPFSPFVTLFGGILFLAAFLFLLAGAIPPFEYDMLEYHAQGAREILETGRIGFFPHNIYLNMPLGTEMLYLAGALLNPFPGSDRLMIGITGAKFFLAFVPLLTALGAALCALKIRGDGGVKNGNVLPIAAALATLSFPELFQVSANGLNDSVFGLFLLGTLYGLIPNRSRRSPEFPSPLLAGLCTGFAAGCKYTAVPFLLVPTAFAFLLPAVRSSQRWRELGLFSAGAAAAGGGWYLKNLCYTGNPFYPLAYSIFGDRTGFWNMMKNLRWAEAHSSSQFSPANFVSDLARVFTEDFASLLFAPLVLLVFPAAVRFFIRRREKQFVSLFVYTVFFFLLWWTVTHRLIRFLVPIIPAASILGALVWDRLRSSAGAKSVRFGFDLFLAAGALYALSVDIAATPGLLVPIPDLLRDTDRYGTAAVKIDTDPNIAAGNEDSPQKLLLAGEARGFAFRRVPVLYNTCWDDSCFHALLPNEWKDKKNWNWSDGEIKYIRSRFQEERIGTVLVDFHEIFRFLSNGNYGLSDAELMTPAFFDGLVKAGILKQVPGFCEDEKIRFYRVIQEEKD